ncbi:MAG: RloB domain-containing protein [Saprospiraceae bacterium]|nr:RloB domain-containing protein [Saprospiraceae bacterium]
MGCFDRDKEHGDNKDTAFNDSIRIALEKGINIAWSNDDFELWILLHFEDVDIGDTEYHHRKKYYERLTDILKKKYPEEKPFTNEKFNYYEAMKNRRNFLTFTYQSMKNNQDLAIERAQKLEKLHEGSEPKPPICIVLAPGFTT